MPRSSTRTWRLVPFFSLVCGIGTYCFPGQWGFVHCSVDTLPTPGNPFQLIVFRQTFLPQFLKQSGFRPALKITMYAAWTPVFAGKRFPLYSRSQNIHDTLKHSTRFQRFASRSATTLILSIAITPCTGNQRFDLRPKSIRDFPRIHCHIHLPSVWW